MMKLKHSLILAAALAGFALPGFAADKPAAVPVLRFAPGAPQLAYLHIQPVVEAPEPASDPLNGRIAYDENRTVRVFSPIAGRVVRLSAQPGDRVKAGQPLLWLNSPDLAAAVADLRKAEADSRAKKSAFQRAKTLYDGEVLARKDFEAAEADLRQSEAEAQRARARLKNLRTAGQGEDGSFPLRAPLSGVVADRQVNPGTEVRPDAPNPLFVITDPAHLWVIVDLAERDLAKAHIGQPLQVETDAYPGERFSARVLSIGEVLDPATRRVQVRAELDNRERRLKPEMYARVTPLTEPARKALLVPNTAIITEGLHSFVFVEIRPGELEKRTVTLGRQGRDYAVVATGLKVGERMVTTGALLLNSELASRK